MADNVALTRAWGGMAWAVLLHVLDEAWNNFLVVYNPTAARDRAISLLPLPVSDSNIGSAAAAGLWLRCLR